MRVSDYIFQELAKYVKHVFFLPGGGSMYLCDSLGHTEGITPINCLHEQAAAFAAEAYSQFAGLGVCVVTSGPGATNAVTGCAAAWCDSRPVLFISGQCKSSDRSTGQRCKGVQEIDIISIVKPITKFATGVLAHNAKFCLAEAIEIAQTPRQGPVWLDIPLDVQGKEV